jgi:hypothetical protein
MIKEALGDALKVKLNIGLAGRAPGEPAPYVAIAHLTFDSVEAFKLLYAAFCYICSRYS